MTTQFLYICLGLYDGAVRIIWCWCHSYIGYTFD